MTAQRAFAGRLSLLRAEVVGESIGSRRGGSGQRSPRRVCRGGSLGARWRGLLRPLDPRAELVDTLRSKRFRHLWEDLFFLIFDVMLDRPSQRRNLGVYVEGAEIELGQFG